VLNPLNGQPEIVLQSERQGSTDFSHVEYMNPDRGAVNTIIGKTLCRSPAGLRTKPFILRRTNGPKTFPTMLPHTGNKPVKKWPDDVQSCIQQLRKFYPGAPFAMVARHPLSQPSHAGGWTNVAFSRPGLPAISSNSTHLPPRPGGAIVNSTVAR
jgi:hypothetical protein